MNQTQARTGQVPCRLRRSRGAQVVRVVRVQPGADQRSVQAELEASLIDQGRRLAAAAERALARSVLEPTLVGEASDLLSHEVTA